MSYPTARAYNNVHKYVNTQSIRDCAILVTRITKRVKAIQFTDNQSDMVEYNELLEMLYFLQLKLCALSEL